MHQHNHGITDPGHTHTVNGLIQLAGTGSGLDLNPGGPTTRGTSSATTGITIDNAGTGTSQNMPPAFMASWIIKL
jgi:hypothetical protein